MVFRRFGRGRRSAITYDRSLGLGLRSDYRRSLGLGLGRGFGYPLSPYNYPNPISPQQSTLYNTLYPQQHPFYPQASLTYQQPYQHQSSTQSLTAIHMNCAYFNNGVCTLRGVSVPANAPACQNFIQRS